MSSHLRTLNVQYSYGVETVCMSSHPHTLTVQYGYGVVTASPHLHTLNCSCCRMKKKKRKKKTAKQSNSTHLFHALAIFSSAGKRCKLKHFLPILHHLSPVILANVTVVAVVLIRNSRYSFHCYTQREAKATQKSPRKWQVRHFETSCSKDYKGHSLVQTSFAELPNRAHPEL